MGEKDTEVGLLSSITRGASLYLIGKIIVDVFGFLLQLILTRSLGAGLYGVYAFGKTILGIFLVFTNLGSDKSLLKHLPQYQNSPVKQRFVFSLALATSFGGALISATVLYIYAPTISKLTLDEPALVDVIQIFSLIIVFDTVSKILYNTFRSLEKLEYEVLTNKLVRPTLRLGGAAVALTLGFSLVGVMIAFTVASLLTLILTFYILLTQFELRPSISTAQMSRTDVYEYYNFSIPLTLQGAGKILIKRIDILMVGFFLSSTAVGIYNIAVLLAGILALPLTAFNQLFPPIASRLYSDGDINRINSLYSTVTRWIFTIVLIMAIGAVTYSRELLALFGEEFTAGAVVLVLFVFGQIFNCAGGANGYLLMMTNRQYLLVLNEWIFGIINILLNYILIIEFGFVGAALATASVLATLNLVKTIELWYLEGLFPYSIEYSKPIISGVGATIVMILVGEILGGLALIIVGGVLGVAVYIISLILLGINKKDKLFIKEIISEIS